ncbi:MAG TPA: hypothetical protein VHD83_20825 [Puia sp.]|nr:hypothetical protein [Puia sp.]
MTNYLLLRDNKQSGPYTFDELKEKGLKAYDLVWIEGKSAAWRYPCEIQELSPFAPQVEEQPFDRFYKKPAQTSNDRPSDNEPSVRSSNDNNNASVTPAPVRTAPNGAVAATILTGDASSSTIPGRRIIYVTLPAGRTAPMSTPPAREIKDPQPREPREPQRELPIKEPAPTPVPVGTFEDNPSQYNEAWKTSVEITPRPDRRSSFRLGQTLMVGLTVLALLVAGIFIGLSLNRDSLGIFKHLSIDNGKDKPATTTNHPSQPLAVNTLPVMPASAKEGTPDKDSLGSSLEKAQPTATSMSSVTPSRTSKERSASTTQKTPTVAPAPRDSSLQALPAVHRESSHRADLTTDKVDKDAVRNNLSNLVSIGSSGYSVGTFGGISGLQLTVSNRSIYPLDLVVVEVQYIQANKKVFKTENLYFRDIAPGSALMQEAPKSSRGIKVQYKITLVNSKELGLSYSAL